MSILANSLFARPAALGNEKKAAANIQKERPVKWVMEKDNVWRVVYAD